MMHRDAFRNLKPQLQGFDNPSLLPRDVREEIESGKAADISEKAGNFLREVEGASELFVIVERSEKAIQSQVTLLSNGDAKVGMTAVPKRDFSPVAPAKRW